MRPDILAEHLATTIRGLITPLQREVQDQKKEIHDLKKENQDLKAAFAASEARHNHDRAAISDLQKSHLDTRQAVQVLETHHPAPPYIDLHAADPMN